MTLAEYVDTTWRPHFDTLRPSNQARTRWLLDRVIEPDLGSIPLGELRAADVAAWYDRQSAKPGNANRALDVLRQIVSHASARGLVDRHPCTGIVRVKRPPRTRYLSTEELRIVHRELRRIQPRGRSGRDQVVLIRLLLLTGMRVGEATALRWQDLRGDGAHVRHGKTGPRTVALSAAARELLAEHRAREGAECPWLFPAADGSGPRSSELSTWRMVRRRAGVPDVRVHDLRHTFASHAVMRGVPLPVVSRLLGHASLQMTMRYAHIGDAEARRAAERIADRIDRWMSYDG